jgi:hypothetical protein
MAAAAQKQALASLKGYVLRTRCRFYPRDTPVLLSRRFGSVIVSRIVATTDVHSAAFASLLTCDSLLKSGAYSDLIVTCGSDTYKVHKAVVCEKADFFARALKFGGKVSA